MVEQIHRVKIGNTRTPLPVTLQQPNVSGVDTAINLTGLTVEFLLLDKAGVETVAQTATGITVTAATSGEVEYDFSAAAVATVGRYYGYFIVTESAEEDHFPVIARELVICVEALA